MAALKGTVLSLFLYIGLVAAGALVGGRIRWGKRSADLLGKLQLINLMILITALGVRLGSDDRVISSLGEIGLTALVLTVSVLAGSVIALALLRRFVLKLDRYGRPAGERGEEDGKDRAGGKADNTLTWLILAAVALGMAAGYFLVPESAAAVCGTVISWGLYILLFLVGMDMGRQGTVLRDVRAAGFRVLLVPAAVMAGTFLFAIPAGLLLGMSAKDAAAAVAGFGWYSLAPTLLAPYSLSLSAVAFLSNVMREVFAVVLIPLTARYAGYLECVALPGAASMDTVLPVVIGATHERITIYSFTSGVVLSLLVPVLVPLIIAL